MSSRPETPKSTKGLIIAAPSSGSGKTLITLALLRALKRSGVKIASAKVGPDYIDPAFHTRASGNPCLNLDTWAMRPAILAKTLNRLCQSPVMVIAEGVMGLFDGAGIDDDLHDGSTASLARQTGWPVILIIDARAQAASAAAVVRGFADHVPDVSIAGVVFNRVGSTNHSEILRRACAKHLPHIPVLGCLPRQEDLVLPERHLGLVQADEHGALDQFLNRASDWVESHLDIELFRSLAQDYQTPCPFPAAKPIPPLGQRVAIAQDIAFAFCYSELLQSWRDAGAEILPFSPLAGEGPAANADSVYLPGGYPELYAGQLATNGFISQLKGAAAQDMRIFGECGGFMVLGSGLIDGAGASHEMAGLLDVETSFADRKLHLGYRKLETLTPSVLGRSGLGFRGHEFHYASVTAMGKDSPLFVVSNAAGDNLGAAGLVRENVAGSYMHLIDVSGA